MNDEVRGSGRGPSPKTIMEAHQLLSHMRPSQAASREKWLTYYRRSAAVYAEVAEIDRGHHHECLYWANRERVKANHLQAEITKNPDPPVVKKVKEEPKESAPTGPYKPNCKNCPN